MARKYSDEVITFVTTYASEYSISDMAELVNRKFGTDFTYERMKTFYSRRHLHAKPMTGRTFPDKRITTPEIDEFIHSHYRGTSHKDMAALVNSRFGTAYTVGQIKAYYNRNHLNSGITGYFPKGHVPFNKGMKWDDYVSPEAQARSRTTTYKPGNCPHNGGTPVGTLRIRKHHRSGKEYYWIKYAQPGTWRMAHVVEWEKHNGPVPAGSVVSFADGDTLNYHIDNLILISRSQLAVKNHLRLRAYDKDSAEFINGICDLHIAMSKARRKKKT